MYIIKAHSDSMGGDKMISKKRFRLKKNGEPYWDCYCRHPELIENYELAIADKTQIWEVHHRREELYSQKELKKRGEYFDVSPEELIFLTIAEHHKMDSMCKRTSEALKGRKRPEGAGKPSKKVLCVETGEIFESTKDAERKTGIDFSNISRTCNGKRKTAGGFHWRYI